MEIVSRKIHMDRFVGVFEGKLPTTSEETYCANSLVMCYKYTILPKIKDIVFDVVIHNSIRSPQQLLNLRLVCKSWNESACAVLRQTFTLPINEEDSPRKMALIFQASKKNKELELPCPFKRLRIIAKVFNRQVFLQFILHLHCTDFIVTELELSKESVVDELSGYRISKAAQERFLKMLQLFFTCHGSTLTTLDFLRLDFPLVEKMFEFGSMEFPDLKYLNLRFGKKFPSFYSLFLGAVLQKSKLDVFKGSFTGDAPTFLSKLNFENVRSMELSMCLGRLHSNVAEGQTVTMGSFSQITTLPLLTSVHLCGKLDPDDTARALQPYSSSIKTLIMVSVVLQLEFFSQVCPNLEEIHCGHFTGQFNPEKFPSLRFVKMLVNPVSGENIIPHLGVKKLTFNNEPIRCHLPFYSAWPASPKEFCNTLTNLGLRFPRVFQLNCGSLDLECFPLTVHAIRALQHAFPYLRSLTMNGKFTGVINAEGTNIGRRAKGLWANFLELETLHLEHDVRVCPDLIQFGFSKIKKLKQLTFHAPRNLTANLLQECLGHVDKIEIHICIRCVKEFSTQESLRMLKPLGEVVHFRGSCPYFMKKLDNIKLC